MMRYTCIIWKLRIAELAVEKKTQDSGCDMSSYVLGLLCLSGRTTTSCTAVGIIQGYHYADSLPSKFLLCLRLLKEKSNSIENSAGSVGMATGGFFFFPLSNLIGRSSAIFWSLVGSFLSQVWAALMIHQGDYNSFIVSRFFGSLFGTITGVLGPRILVDLFFLHQRGRAFTIFHWSFDFGTVAGPTISAFISANTSWTYAYWWTAGLVGFALFPVFLFLHDTSWNRENEAINRPLPGGFLANRFATFCVGTKVTPKTSFHEIVSPDLRVCCSYVF
jgi:MFS family permease